LKDIFRIFSDILKWPFLSFWLKITAQRIHILPGQVWHVPGVGAVLIRMTDKRSVYYTSLESKFYENNSEIILKSERVEFLINSTRYSSTSDEEPPQNEPPNVLNIYDFKKGTSDKNEH
jgi:hypothetical protein